VAVLERDLSEARRGGDMSLVGVQEQLRAAEETAAALRSERQVREARHERVVADFESANQQLGASLAQQQALLARAQTQLEEAGATEARGVQRQIDGMRQQQEALLQQLESAEKRNQLLEGKLTRRDCELKAGELNLLDERSRAQAAAESQRQQLARLQAQLAAAMQRNGQDGESDDNDNDNDDGGGGGSSSSSSSSNRTEKVSRTPGGGPSGAGNSLAAKNRQLETQLQGLASQLLRKQGQVEELMADKSALRVRLKDLADRSSAAEAELTSLRDLEMYGTAASGYVGGGGGAGGASGDGSGGGARLRGGTKLTAQLGIKASPRVAHAINQFDAWTLLSGHALRTHPAARLAFVFYLLVLHLWALAVLALHTHSLEDEDSLMSGPLDHPHIQNKYD
jgi:hypothetical protein